MSLNFFNRVKGYIVIVISLFSLIYNTASAGITTTRAVIMSESVSITKAQLNNALDNSDIQKQLADYGVEPEMVRERISQLTPEELNLLNEQIQTMPAGGDISIGLGAILLFLIITDLLCLTNIFAIIGCIKR